MNDTKTEFLNFIDSKNFVFPFLRKIFNNYFNRIEMTTKIKEVSALLMMEYILSRLMARLNEVEEKIKR